MASPTAIAEIAFATDPGATPVWTDVSPWLQSVQIARGRQQELNRMEAGTARLLLDNLDRRFDPTNAASPYAPNVVPMRRVRLSAAYGYKGRVRRDGPVGYWRLGEPSGTVAIDTTGNGHTGTYTGGVTLAQPGALADADTAALFNGTTGQMTTAAFAHAGPVTVEAWLKFSVAPGVGNYYYAIDDGALTLYVNPVGQIGWQVTDGTHYPFASSPATYADGVWHHIVGVRSAGQLLLYIDGGLGASATDTTTGPLAIGATLYVGGRASVFLPGSLDEVAIYSTALSAAQIAAHYAERLTVGGDLYRLFSGYAETWPPTYPGPLDSNVEVSAVDAFKVFNLKNLNTSYASELSGTRIGHVLDDIGWPAGDRLIAAGDSTIQASTLVNVSALQHLAEVIDAENGLLFCNGAGQVVFVNRGARIIAPYTVAQGTFGDGGGGEFLYADAQFDYSDVQLWNEIRLTRVGGAEQVVSDSGSQTRYYPRTLSKTGLLMNTDPDVLAAAQWILGRYKTPALRVKRLVLDGDGDPSNLWPQLFGRELGDRVTVRKTPPGGGARMEQQGYIEHIEHTFSAAGGVWSTTWQLSPADLQLYWILDNATQSVLDGTTVLSY